QSKRTRELFAAQRLESLARLVLECRMNAVLKIVKDNVGAAELHLVKTLQIGPRRNDQAPGPARELATFGRIQRGLRGIHRSAHQVRRLGTASSWRTSVKRSMVLVSTFARTMTRKPSRPRGVTGKCTGAQ